MQIFAILIVVALTFGVCYLFDKGFTKIFRSKAQHQSGLSVRANRRYVAFGAILILLGTAAIFPGLSGSKLLIAGGCLLILVGIGMAVYYVTFGIFYDADSFIYTSFGKKSVTYEYRDIKAQQLYTASGNTLIELHMTDGKTIGLQTAMAGVYPFMDIAFAGWCRQTGKTAEDCPFYDPANTCWFPPVEDQ